VLERLAEILYRGRRFVIALPLLVVVGGVFGGPVFGVGPWNWWTPAPLARLQARIGLSDST